MTKHTTLAPLASLLLLPALALGTSACDDTVDPVTPGDLVIPDDYDFDSVFEEGVGSVSFDGQTMRHVLIGAMTREVARINQGINAGTLTPADADELFARLDFYFRFDSESAGDANHDVVTDPAPLQVTWDDISRNKDLVGKLAGNDPSTDHRVWNDGAFEGWSDTSVAAAGGDISTPTGLVEAFMWTIASNAYDAFNGINRTAPDGTVLPAYVTESGQDLQQLLQKFLLGGIAFSQGVDDYLDDDVDGKGILSPNTRDGNNPWTVLEHQWDEGFGYFGASIHYGRFGTDLLAGAAVLDVNDDGAIDLLTEVSYGHSTNAAKRDRDTRGGDAPTDLVGQAWDAFRTGRAIITRAAAREDSALTPDEFAALVEQRDLAAQAWEQAIAATVVHYINDTIDDLNLRDTDDFSFLDLAKHWGEMKGFALSFQFNRLSPILDRFAELHALLRDAPTVPGVATEDEILAYIEDLLEARDMLRDAYGFDADNVAVW